MVRNAKPTVGQLHLLVDLLEGNPELVNNRLITKFTGRDRAERWKEIAEHLNAYESGTQKTVTKWQKTWTDLKYCIRSKAAKLQASLQHTGEGAKPADELSALDLRILNLIGWDWAARKPEVEEAGVDNSEDEPSEIIVEFDDPYDAILGPSGASKGGVAQDTLDKSSPVAKKRKKEKKVNNSLHDASNNTQTTDEVMDTVAWHLASISQSHRRLASAEERKAAAFERIAAVLESQFGD